MDFVNLNYNYEVFVKHIYQSVSGEPRSARIHKKLSGELAQEMGYINRINASSPPP